MPVSYPEVIYGESSSLAVTPRLIVTPFGDGYQQNVPDGINSQPRSGTLVHPILPLADETKTVGANTMRTFLKSVMNGTIVTIINYMEDPTGATTMNVYITGYATRYAGVTTTFSVKFVEAFGV